MGTLRIDELNLVGAGRSLMASAGLNVIAGDITTGKTTLVRLMRAFLGGIPKNLPPETTHIERLAGRVTTSHRSWDISRPFVTTDTAPVDISNEETAYRLPAARPTRVEPRTYASFLMDEAGIPSVHVPSRRSNKNPSANMTPVSINDWLNYCILAGDEIDVMVFGHKDPFRDIKRRYVFEINYGLYDPQAARVTARIRELDLKEQALRAQAEAARLFLSNTPFADRRGLEEKLAEAEAERRLLASRQAAFLDSATTPHEGLTSSISRARTQLLSREDELSRVRSEQNLLQSQVQDLKDLRTELIGQISRLNRAIVSAETLTDIDFVICPRCGQDLDNRPLADADHCRLCLQETVHSDDVKPLIVELSRLQAQVEETDEVLRHKQIAIDEMSYGIAQLASEVERLHTSLNSATSSFISRHADEIAAASSAKAYADAEVGKLEEYLDLYVKQDLLTQDLEMIRQEREELEDELAAIDTSGAMQNVALLEKRFGEYLEKLHAPLIDSRHRPEIDRTTYMPKLGNRTFDKLSSQGLATLVNVAHALAHHTVSLDLGLPLPAFLVFDGLSSNIGHENFDADRVRDMYRLILEVCERYGDRLQVFVLDNVVEPMAMPYLRLQLTPENRLIVV